MRTALMTSRRSLLLSLCSVFLLSLSGYSYAAAGKVVNVSGPLFAVASSGAKRVLSVGSEVEQGDTLITEEKTYARVKFTDQGDITLRPGTQLKVDSYVYAQEKPAEDNVALSLFKGALRSVTGLIGKRGNQDAYKLQTATATIGIRGTDYVVEYVPGPQASAVAANDAPYNFATAVKLAALEPSWLNQIKNVTMTDAPSPLYVPELITEPPMQLAQNTPGTGGGLAPGLYVHVIDGLINLSNRGGVQQFAAGQFGFTGSVVQPPVIVPTNPGIQFNPPPSFSASTSQGGGSSKPKTVDCEVR
jgi:hypothetical protein